ncbi:MAG TPA: hypothetical protein VHL57_01395 [Flavobacteriales bacterium]|jgi:hypothetical protein|nr:hypothetical protein [Flavobacteriales bacterium]
MSVAPIRTDGRLTEAAVIALHAVSGVPMDLLRAARIRPATRNWLRAPWYGYARGGALTLGRSIYFTRRYFDPQALADGSIASTWAWLKLLAHEVGHLPQAARYGYSALGLTRYLAAFTAQYGSRALTFRKAVHDGAKLEIEADKGRWVLMNLVTGEPAQHPLVRAVHNDDSMAAGAWYALNQKELENLRWRYSSERRTASSAG